MASQNILAEKSSPISNMVVSLKFGDIIFDKSYSKKYRMSSNLILLFGAAKLMAYENARKTSNISLQMREGQILICIVAQYFNVYLPALELVSYF
jgi:hypothetical protein